MGYAPYLVCVYYVCVLGGGGHYINGFKEKLNFPCRLPHKLHHIID